MHCLCGECGRPSMKGNENYDLSIYLKKKFAQEIGNYGFDVRSNRKRRTGPFGIATASDLDRIMTESMKVAEVNTIF